MQRNTCFLAVAFFLLPVLHAQAADLSKDIASCAAISGDLARLDCFDALSHTNALDEPKISTPAVDEPGAWQVTTEVNPVDDSKTVILAIRAEEGARSRFGETPALFIRCKSNETELYINWHDYLGSEAVVLSRIGSEKASSKEWTLSSDKKASFFPANPVPFIKKMAASDRFVVQLTPYNENPVTAVFNVAGLSNALKPLQETCNWK